MALVRMFGQQFAADLIAKLSQKSPKGEDQYQAISRAHTGRTVPGTTITVAQSEIIEAAAAEMPPNPSDAVSAANPAPASSSTSGPTEAATTAPVAPQSNATDSPTQTTQSASPAATSTTSSPSAASADPTQSQADFEAAMAKERAELDASGKSAADLIAAHRANLSEAGRLGSQRAPDPTRRPPGRRVPHQQRGNS